MGPRRYRYLMSPRTERIVAATSGVTERIGDQVRETLDEVKPHLRGWIHAASAPLTLAAGIVLVVLSPTATSRIGSAVFATSALVLFTVSAIYHRGTWSPRVWRFLRRFDHANIFLLIAGSYTPFTLLLLEGTDRVVLLSVVWTGAVLGRAVPGVLERRAALALHPDLHGAGLGGGLLLRRLRARTRTPPCGC